MYCTYGLGCNRRTRNLEWWWWWCCELPTFATMKCYYVKLALAVAFCICNFAYCMIQPALFTYFLRCRKYYRIRWWGGGESGEQCSTRPYRWNSRWTLRSNNLFFYVRRRTADCFTVNKQWLWEVNDCGDQNWIHYVFQTSGVRGWCLQSAYNYLLSVPPPSVEAERAFSAAGLLCTKIRSRMSDKSLDAVCFLY